ncbi:hypothetical protein [Halobacterium wangiae]|uniref:hypothetical protein n=1 Tax=Halobacterium wangiae TaxID=2902623 RepID=UPI001E3440E1|nr:hypothetical protein [Halobacterium wangiae]
MTRFDLSTPLAFALAAGAVALVTAFAVGTVGFGDPIDEAALRAGTIAVGVVVGTFLVRRADATEDPSPAKPKD